MPADPLKKRPLFQRLAIPAGILLFLIFAPAWTGLSQTADPAAAKVQDTFAGTIEDRPAPDFRLEKLGGGTAGISSYYGKVIILNFWATWCLPCREEMPDFVTLQSRYGKEGLQIVGVSLDRREDVEKYLQKAGVNYTILFGTREVSAMYGGVGGLPTTFIINREGILVLTHEGLATRAFWEQEIKKLL